MFCPITQPFSLNNCNQNNLRNRLYNDMDVVQNDLTINGNDYSIENYIYV